jgi:hypothetical protein
MAEDLGCGFQPNLSDGTRSKVFRVLAISASNSGNSAWEIAIETGLVVAIISS